MTTKLARAWKPVAAAGGLALAAGILGALVTDLSPWYYNLRKPAWQPPDWLFGPVWTTIFALAAAAGVLVWKNTASASVRRWIVALYLFNIALNIGWSGLFFRLQRPDWALLEVTFLWASIAALMWASWPRSKTASLLLLPYLVWVSFASVLNVAIVQLNGPFRGL